MVDWPTQEGWRYCSRCQRLAFGGGRCHDGEPHYFGDSGAYRLKHSFTLVAEKFPGMGDQPPGTQLKWRLCTRCSGLAYIGFGRTGTCWDGADHDLTGSAGYAVPIDSTPPGNQDGWRYCGRCQGLVYGAVTAGICWDEQPHLLEGSAAYSVPFTRNRVPDLFPDLPETPHQTMIDLFVFGSGQIHTSWWTDGQPWSSTPYPWAPLGGPTGQVTAISRQPEKIDLFGVDRDHKVYTAWHHDGMDWSCWTDKSREWKSVGGDFPEGALVAATSRFADNIDLFIVGGDGHVYTSWWYRGQEWSGLTGNWQDIGGVFPAAAPISAVTRTPKNMDLFVIGNDGRVYNSWWYEGAKWSGVNSRWRNIGGDFRPHGQVTAISRGPDVIDLFAMGNDGCVYTAWWYAGQDWSGLTPGTSWGGSDIGGSGSSGGVNHWRNIGGYFPPGATITVVARSPRNIDLFVVGNDHQVYTSWWWEGQDWSGLGNRWRSLGGDFPLGAHVTATTRSAGNLDIFAVGQNQHTLTKWWYDGQDWSGSWADLYGDFPPGSRIAALGRIGGWKRETQPKPLDLRTDINTDDSAAVRGSARILINPNGSFRFDGHFHATGFESYRFNFTWVITTTAGETFEFSHDGTVHGTSEWPKPRDNDHSYSGSNPRMRDHWSAIVNGSNKWTVYMDGEHYTGSVPMPPP